MNFQFAGHTWKLLPANVAKEKISKLDLDLNNMLQARSVVARENRVDTRLPELRNKCTKCANFIYSTTEEFRDHCRSDWHIYNLKSPSVAISFEDWCTRLSNPESESVSSDCESSDDDEIICSTVPVFYGTRWKITDVGNVSVVSPDVLPSPWVLWEARYVCVLLLRSGRFAGAVWDGSGNVLVHTCFKRYTVRRKNGGSQSRHDASRGSLAHSVGAQIRRAQEKKLDEELGDLIQKTWRQFFVKNSIVFAYASKSLVDSMFVGPLERTSERQCTVFPVPLSVNTPTYAEVVRIHKILTSIGLSDT